MIYTVITKPTRLCNADCNFCSSPPDDKLLWSFQDFKLFFDNIEPDLADSGFIIWHGGEPMLLGPDFYQQCAEYAWQKKPNLRFSMQTNLLLYDTNRWKPIFENIFQGSISTSYETSVDERTLNGDPIAYKKRFERKLKEVIDDGFRPMVISTYTTENADQAKEMYNLSLGYGDKAFPLRFNYRYPAGRESDQGERISPKHYGELLVELYNRWIQNPPVFTITPLDQMLKKVIGEETQRCPWTRHCGGHFLGIEPNGDTYNCADFADLNDPHYRMGNLFKDNYKKINTSYAMRLMRRRRTHLPFDCTQCRHFNECEGGCMRDAVLYHHGLGGKFHYCESWMMVFDRIKNSIQTGEADQVIAKYGIDPNLVRKKLAA